jgi:hypothetical protein
MGLGAEGAGIWVSPRRLWLPTLGDTSSLLSVCAQGRGCVPIASQETCAPPSCPGGGPVLVADRDLAPVGDFPRDREGYSRELESIRASPQYAAVHPYLVEHPDHYAHLENVRRSEEAAARERSRHSESTRWTSPYRDGDRLELSLSASVASLVEADGTYWGGTAGAAYVFLLDANDADDQGDEGIFNLLFGDTLGGELRVHFLYRVDTQQEAEWITAIGFSPLLVNRFEQSIVRLPTLMGTVMPEVGLILRADRDPTWYVGWSLPFSLLVGHDVAFDIAARIFLVDEWIELAPEDESTEDPAEAIVMLSAGFRMP